MFEIMKFCDNLDLLKYLKDKDNKKTQLKYVWRVIAFFIIGLDELYDIEIFIKIFEQKVFY